jgi:hypothetical protein
MVSLVWWRGGVVVIVSADRTEYTVLESRQGVWVLGLYRYICIHIAMLFFVY